MTKADKKPIGVTLLFSSKKSKLYTAFLKSYILEIGDWRSLKNKIRSLIKKDKDLSYVGLEDIFYVSGAFGEKEVLGKSYIDELTSIKEARTLLLKERDYTCNFQSKIENRNWYLISLIYFYHDVKIKDKLIISCYTPVLANDIKSVKAKIKLICRSQSFLKKLLPYRIDKMDYKNLKYIGIEDIILIKENVLNGGAYETTFNNYRKFEKIKALLPPEEELKGFFEKTI